jgi:hypothetical protein
LRSPVLNYNFQIGLYLTLLEHVNIPTTQGCQMITFCLLQTTKLNFVSAFILYDPSSSSSSYLEQVNNEGENVAHEKYDHDDHEHRGHPDLSLLQPGQLGARGVGLADLQVDAQVEHGQAGEGDDVHHHQVHPRDVNAEEEEEEEKVQLDKKGAICT